MSVPSLPEIYHTCSKHVFQYRDCQNSDTNQHHESRGRGERQGRGTRDEERNRRGGQVQRGGESQQEKEGQGEVGKKEGSRRTAVGQEGRSRGEAGEERSRTRMKASPPPQNGREVRVGRGREDRR
ncbi:hypothetical protein Tco_1276043 [Tanacetum coccineum]